VKRSRRSRGGDLSIDVHRQLAGELRQVLYWTQFSVRPRVRSPTEKTSNRRTLKNFRRNWSGGDFSLMRFGHWISTKPVRCQRLGDVSADEIP